MAERVLVTGGAGYIGSHAVLALLEAGYDVVVVDDLSAGSRKAVPAAAVFVEMDCGDPRLAGMMAQWGISSAMHFAARIRLDESVRVPLVYYNANFCTARAFLESAALAGVNHVVFSSTAAVYGETGNVPVSEDRLPQPATPYGRSKLAVEWLLEDLGRASKMRYVALRYFNVAGADPQSRTGPRADAAHLLKLVAEAVAGIRETITINGQDWPTRDGTCVRDYIHVSDLAAAHVSALRHLLQGGTSTVLNCGYGRGFTVREVVQAGLSIAQRPFEVFEGPRREGDMASVVADVSRIKQVLDWQPRHDRLQDMLSSGVAWERARARC
jgi:UDP-glucose 4-epimerase